jgi:hypothetical protein
MLSASLHRSLCSPGRRVGLYRVAVAGARSFSGEHRVSAEVCGREFSLEVGRIGPLTESIVFARYGNTSVLATAAAADAGGGSCGAAGAPRVPDARPCASGNIGASQLRRCRECTEYTTRPGHGEDLPQIASLTLGPTRDPRRLQPACGVSHPQRGAHENEAKASAAWRCERWKLLGSVRLQPVGSGGSSMQVARFRAPLA